MEDMEYKVAERIMDLYVDYRQDFVWMNTRGDTFRPRPRRTLTIGEILQHLDGGNTVSVLANARSTIFLCFDVDVKDRDRVNAIRYALIDMGISDDYIYVSTSGGKGYHVEVFFDGEIWNTRAENLYKLVFQMYGVDKTNVEYMPTAKKAIKLPLGINHKTGNRCWYINKETFEPIEDYEYIFQIKRFSVEKLEEILHKKNKERFYRDLETAAKPVHGVNRYNYEFPVITEQGQRHKMMCSVAMHYHICGLDEDGIYTGLLEWVDKQDRRLIESTDSEIERDARSIAHSVMKMPVTEREQKPKRELPPDMKTYVTAGDVERILTITSKSYRKVAFLLFAYCRRFETAVLSYDQMEEITGLTRAYVIRAVKELADPYKYIAKKEIGGFATRHGQRVRLANEYNLVGGDDGGRRYWMALNEINEQLDDTYYKALVALGDKEKLKEVLTRTEKEIIKNGSHK